MGILSFLFGVTSSGSKSNFTNRNTKADSYSNGYYRGYDDGYEDSYEDHDYDAHCGHGEYDEDHDSYDDGCECDDY